jgi:hypothetical protein
MALLYQLFVSALLLLLAWLAAGERWPGGISLQTEALLAFPIGIISFASHPRRRGEVSGSAP